MIESVRVAIAGACRNKRNTSVRRLRRLVIPGQLDQQRVVGNAVNEVVDLGCGGRRLNASSCRAWHADRDNEPGFNDTVDARAESQRHKEHEQILWKRPRKPCRTPCRTPQFDTDGQNRTKPNCSWKPLERHLRSTLVFSVRQCAIEPGERRDQAHEPAATSDDKERVSNVDENNWPPYLFCPAREGCSVRI